MLSIVDRLLHSGEPSVRYIVRRDVLGDRDDAPDMAALRDAVRESSRVQALLAQRRADGTLPWHPYRKWTGAHWVLALLAGLGYPPGVPGTPGGLGTPGDRSLGPLVDQAAAWVLGIEATIIAGRPRRCASQQGNLLLSMLRLGLADARCDELAARLVRWQWADGGWNCDRRPDATHSSFHESLIPLRALNAYARATGSDSAQRAAAGAAELFLGRQLYLRHSTGEPIAPGFARTHYPYFWQYTFLHGLRAMAECGLLADPRCAQALDLLESKRCPDGGFPAEEKHWWVVGVDERRPRSGQTLVDWGPTGLAGKRSNEFVTAEALAVLAAAGRV